MKNKWKWIYNPFERIAGLPALMIGIVVMALTAIIGKINGVAFNGVLNVGAGASITFAASFAMQAVNYLALFLSMWIAGILFSKSKVRAVDVAGTMALSRTPMLLLVVICFLPIVPVSMYEIPRLIIFGLIGILFVIWMIALMYNAYSVSCNLKGARVVVSFIGTLLVAEIVSLLVFFFLLSSLFINNPTASILGSNSTENKIVVADSLTIRQKTENVVKAFKQSDFDAITVYFDSTMKKGLPAGGLRIAWIQTNLTCGQFEKANLDSLKETRIDNYDVIEVPFTFQKENRNLRLAFSSAGEISGLFFLPVNQ